jgi:hypothetical protein
VEFKGAGFDVHALKLKFAAMEAEEKHFWQRRFYDFNVWSEQKFKQKLVYMHGNPVSGDWCYIQKTGLGAVGNTMR